MGFFGRPPLFSRGFTVHIQSDFEKPGMFCADFAKMLGLNLKMLFFQLDGTSDALPKSKVSCMSFSYAGKV